MERNFADRELFKAQSDAPESFADKAMREVSLVREGLLGFNDAARVAIVEKPLQTAANLALAAGAGVALAYLSRGQGFGKLAVRAASGALSISFLADVAANGASVASALQDNWRSDSAFDQNSAVMRKSLGKFAFDTALLSAGSLSGARLGQSLFLKLDRLKMPAEFFTQMEPSGVTADYHNKFITPGHYASVARNAEGKFSPEKVLKAQQKLPQLLKEIPTYREYWQQRINEHVATAESPVDKAATQRVFVQSQPSARLLDKLSAELRGFGNSDLTNQQILQQVGDRFSQIHSVVYGK